MLVIISDIHLGDGTTASSISPAAFELFANRLNQTALHASFRGEEYRPIESLDLVLLGDIIDPLHSTLWLDTSPGDPDYTRPWTDPRDPIFAAKLAQTTDKIIEENSKSLDVLKRCASGEVVQLPPAASGSRPDLLSRERIPVPVRIHYMVGNHDWYYHLQGEAFDQIRRTIIGTMGLCNDAGPFPYEVEENPALHAMLESYGVFARHGDYYDKFNFNREKGRDHATLGDIFTMDVCNRYPVVVEQLYGKDLPAGIVNSLRRITNVRPALATPLWISGQIRRYANNTALEDELKEVWDKLCDEFLEMDVVREQDKAFKFDMVDAMQLILKISKRASFETLNDIIIWVHNRLREHGPSLADDALKEPAFLQNQARFVVYGHTHQHEIIPLDSDGEPPMERDQFYINSGTWRSYYDLALKNIREQKFTRYQTFTYLTFYKDDERSGRRFEAWSGTLV